MGCLFALVAAFSARFALFLLWLFTNRLTVAFHSGWEGIIGFIFLPVHHALLRARVRPGEGRRRVRLGHRGDRHPARRLVAPLRLARRSPAAPGEHREGATPT